MSCSLIFVVLSMIGYFWSGGLTLCFLALALIAYIGEYEAMRAAMTPQERERERAEQEAYYAAQRARRRERSAQS